MEFALLFLGLLPLAFLAESFGFGPDDDASASDEEGGDDGGDAGDAGAAGMMALTAEEDADPAEGADEDKASADGSAEEPAAGPRFLDDTRPGLDRDGGTIPVGESDDALGPVTGPDTPVAGVDTGAALAPVDDIGDGAPVNATLLQSLLLRDSDADDGAGFLTDGLAPVLATLGGEEGDTLAGDGAKATGMHMIHGTPHLSGDGPLDLLDGAGGDDDLTLGSGYGFGGSGDDTLSATGRAALFGGAGDDSLALGEEDGFLDGGTGDDTLSGGAGDDILRGGLHTAAPSGETDDDTLFGGAGDDILLGGAGSDSLSGGEGDDRLDHNGPLSAWNGTEGRVFADMTDGAADTLDGGAGDDALVFDRHDTATGGSGADRFWLFHDSADGEDVARITDFEPGVDILQIDLNPDLVASAPEVTVSASEDGADGVVRVGGEVVAILSGVPDASLADIRASVSPDLFT